MEIIKLENITKKYKKEKVLNNLNLSIESGQISGIIGPNGAGKSTTLSIMADLIPYDSGKVTYKGLSIKNAKGKIGFIPQEIALYDSLSGYENLKFFASLYGIKGKAAKNTILEVCQYVGLEEKIKSKVKTYSGGMKRRLNIAAALLNNPELLIMDEPTVGIDIIARNNIIEILKKINKKGITIVFTSHYMIEIEKLCTDINFIKKGKIVEKGKIEDIKTKYNKSNLEEVYTLIFG